MRVLVAPQEFKGSLSAEEAADAIAAGIASVRPEIEVDRLPLADGGPGFIEALRRAVRADTSAVVVRDPLGRSVMGRFLAIPASQTAIVEAAQANGLMHVSPEKRDAVRADSFGVGEFITGALQEGMQRLVVGVGGSATTDGGAGMARALGAHFLDDAGRPLPPGGGALADLARIDWQPPAALAGREVIVATDVTNPLLGPSGAASIYGPQKGASPEQVDLLEAALTRFAAVVRRSLGVDVATIAGGGAAGGLAAGLVAFLGARIVSGFDVVAEATGLPGRLRAADVVITGEGRVDSQTTQGKGTGRLIELARDAGKPVVVFGGSADATREVRTLVSLEPDVAVAMRDARQLLKRLSAEWAASLPPAR